MRCAYCEAENITGLGIYGTLEDASHEESLETELATLRARAMLRAVLAVVGFGTTIALVAGLVRSLS